MIMRYSHWFSPPGLFPFKLDQAKELVDGQILGVDGTV